MSICNPWRRDLKKRKGKLMECNTLVTVEKDIGKRIDVFVNENLLDCSRSYIQKLIEGQNITANGKKVKPSYKLSADETIMVCIPPSEELKIEKEKIDLEVVYEDRDVIIIDKPQDMVVHPAPGNYSGTLVNALLYHCTDLSGINGVLRPGIVHRIDKDTSGLLMVAKNDKAHCSLAEQLKEHTINRVYYALVNGNVKNDKGTIDAPLGRHPVERKKIAVVDRGRRAVTHFEVVERFSGYTLIKARLETGRTHQIRVHMAYIGHPLVGDMVYGPSKSPFKVRGQMLHAAVLGFRHPSTNEYIEFTSPLPQYFESILKGLRNRDR